MENSEKIRIEVHINSFVETLIKEFSGIPGIKLDIVSPRSFKLLDKTAQDSYCEVILIKKYGMRWHFKFYSNVTRTFEDFYSISDIDHVSNMAYVENTIFTNMLTALFNVAATILPDAPDVKYYRPSVAYINAGVAFNILRCGERKIVTDCHFIHKDTDTIFNTSFVANDLLNEIDTLRNTNEKLNARILELEAQAIKEQVLGVVSSDKLVLDSTNECEHIIETLSTHVKFADGFKIVEDCIKERKDEDKEC